MRINRMGCREGWISYLGKFWQPFLYDLLCLVCVRVPPKEDSPFWNHTMYIYIYIYIYIGHPQHTECLSLSQKQDRVNTCVIKKIMCPPLGYHHNDFVIICALYLYGHNWSTANIINQMPKCICCDKSLV